MTKNHNENLHGWSKEKSPRDVVKLVLLGFVIGFVVEGLCYGRWTELFLWNTFGFWFLPFGVWFIIPACIIGTVILFKH